MPAKQKTALVLALSMLCCGLIVPQDNKTKTSPAKTKSESAAAATLAYPMPKAAPEMTRLNKQILGAWKTTQTFETSALMSRGGTNRGTVSITPGPGGLSTFLEFRAPAVAGGAGACTAHSVIYYDPAEQGFRNLWCDATTPGGCTSSKVGVGKWEGDKLVFNGEQLAQGKKMTTKTTYAFPSASSLIVTEEGAVEGEPMKLLMTVKFSK